MTGQNNPRTSITYEIPSAEGDPYYPIPRPENAALYTKHQALTDAARNVTFVDRLRGRKPAIIQAASGIQLQQAGE